MIQQPNVKAATVLGSCLFIGQDHCGRWVVRDAHSLCGGLFTNRKEAIRFAMYECQRRPQSVIMLPDGLELDAAFDCDAYGNPAKRRAAYRSAMLSDQFFPPASSCGAVGKLLQETGSRSHLEPIALEFMEVPS